MYIHQSLIILDHSQKLRGLRAKNSYKELSAYFEKYIASSTNGRMSKSNCQACKTLPHLRVIIAESSRISSKHVTLWGLPFINWSPSSVKARQHGQSIESVKEVSPSSAYLSRKYHLPLALQEQQERHLVHLWLHSIDDKDAYNVMSSPL